MATLESTGARRHIHTYNQEITGHSQCGFLFDVTVKNFHLAITAVSFIPDTRDGEYDIWTAQGTHENCHTDPQAWTQEVKGAYHRGPIGQSLRVPLPRPLSIPAGDTVAFYICGNTVSAICFSTEVTRHNSAENEDLIIQLGHFKGIPWEGVLSTGPFGHNGRQEFVGSLEYQVVQSLAADQVVAATSRIWEKRLFADAELVAENGARFAVHRSVLAASSVVFDEAWRQLPMGEEPLLRVDAPEETVEALLRFAYTGYDKNIPDPAEMLKLAHAFGLLPLVQTCAHLMASGVSKENAVESIRALRPYKEQRACESAWRLLLANLRELLARDDDLLDVLCMSV